METTKRQHLIKTLNSEGMTVLLTRDHSAIILELAMRRRFERMVRAAVADDAPMLLLLKDIDRGSATIRASLPQ